MGSSSEFGCWCFCVPIIEVVRAQLCGGNAGNAEVTDEVAAG